ncbi:acyltransferase family protein [Profundibacter sp.]|uniref:acyltransferase family protein n=1 Tax=Profundibacter sp. TaxID=3101071 RepID=UPI003D1460E4
MNYRREIDGLRAIAVLPVILYHAGFSVFQGGYVGVDVFFVISGFLITTIILNDLKQGRFSILRFYERRARRILPALFTVVAACLPFAWVWMTPVQMDKFSQSVLATFLFLSNIYFWRDSGYFAAAADEKPLIHTWSLAVEEQFYLLFPLLLLLLWKRGGRPGTFWISVLAVASLLFSQWASAIDPEKNFFWG